jgi:hypothetical protein
MRLRPAFLVLALAAFPVLGGGAAQAGEKWVRLGERVVDDRLDHDSIGVGSSRGRFDRVRITVRGRPVHFLDVKVHFANGKTWSAEIRKLIPAGGSTKEIELPGGEREIRSVEFWYETQSPGKGKRATVELHGRR